MKNKETLEEAAEKFEYTDGIYGFKQGVKWEQERSYSDEEVKFIINKLAKDCYFMQEPNQNIAKWFEQFKKK